jgi:hypothetical protein
LFSEKGKSKNINPVLKTKNGPQPKLRDYSCLKDRHPGVLNRVELNAGKMEPYAMDALNPIVRKRQEP